MNLMQPLQVLIVDDTRANVEVFERIIMRIPNVTCAGFTSSLDALKWSGLHNTDLVLVDYEMPPPDGLEFIRRFRAMPAHSMTPIIMITGSRDSAVRHKALELGANDFLTKPADPVEFIARTRNLLQLREGQKKLADQAVWLRGEVERATTELRDREREAIFQLLRVAEFRDNETANHIVRIGHLAALLAETIGQHNDESELLRLAAPMHDIGKVSTPDSILLKKGKLTADEWVIMRDHTTAGYEILKNSKSPMLKQGAEIALSHHEKYDGSGYPSGIKGTKIPLAGRITALVDVFDALTSERPYKKAWTYEQTISEIRRGIGSHFDPDLVEAFLGVMPAATAIKLKFADKVAAHA